MSTSLLRTVVFLLFKEAYFYIGWLPVTSRCAIRGFSSSAVYGEQTEKLTALRQIAEIEQVEAAQLTFFDDNLLNTLQAREAGYRAYWALWGYHVPEHLELARKAGIVGLSLSDFMAMMQGTAAHAGA